MLQSTSIVNSSKHPRSVDGDNLIHCPPSRSWLSCGGMRPFARPQRVIWLALFLGLAAAGLMAQEPKLAGPDKIAEMIALGDRAADDGRYEDALTRYTKAYVEIVSKIRRQTIQHPVKVQIMSPEQLRDELVEMTRKEFTPQELELMEATYRAFGLIPPDVKLDRLIINLLGEQVAGFYDPETKRMVLIVDQNQPHDPSWLARLFGAKPAFDKDEQKATLAHELTHALQDQLYDLNAMDAAFGQDDDMELAFTALVEGDAMLVMLVDSSGEDVTGMNVQALRVSMQFMAWLLPFGSGSELQTAPPIMRDTLIFPYMDGLTFAAEIVTRRGWEGLHQVFQSPPLSTEQVLHPHKYLDDPPDQPRAIRIPQLPEQLTARWKHLGGDCMGELQTRILLKSVIGGSRAAAGWDGDRYEVYVDGDGKYGLVWVSVWDSPADAREFANCYIEYRKPRSHHEPQVFHPEAVSTVITDDDRVWILEGFSSAETQAIVARLPACEIIPKTMVIQ